jgi:hypothetical protein
MCRLSSLRLARPPDRLGAKRKEATLSTFLSSQESCVALLSIDQSRRTPIADVVHSRTALVLGTTGHRKRLCVAVYTAPHTPSLVLPSPRFLSLSSSPSSHFARLSFFFLQNVYSLVFSLLVECLSSSSRALSSFFFLLSLLNVLLPRLSSSCVSSLCAFRYSSQSNCVDIFSFFLYVSHHLSHHCNTSLLAAVYHQPRLPFLFHQPQSREVRAVTVC